MTDGQLLDAPAAWAQAAARQVRHAAAWGVPPPALDDVFLNRPFHETVLGVASRMPDRIAARDGDRSLTFHALAHLIQALGTLVPHASDPARPVGILVTDSVRYMATVVGVWASGRVALLLDANHPADRTRLVMDGAGVALVVTDDGTPDAVLHGRRVLNIDRDLRADTVSLPRVDPDAPCCIIGTSGSTGNPKLIVHSARTMAYRATIRAQRFGITSADTMFIGGNAQSTFGEVTHSVSGLATGATLELLNLRRIGLREAIARLVAARPTMARLPPSLARTLLDVDGASAALAHLHHVRVSAEQPLWSDIHALRRVVPANCHILNCYSSTEGVGTLWPIPTGTIPEQGIVPAGVLEGEGSYLLLDDDGQPVAAGQDGELVWRGRFLAIGEWIDGRLQPGRMAPDPSDPSYRIFRTGDLTRESDDGVLTVLGRKDRMVKINGIRVEPAEVEQAILAWPSVRDVVVLPVATPASTTLIACLEPSGAFPPDAISALRRHLRTVLPSHMVPSRVTVLDRLPRLPNGKVDAVALTQSTTTQQGKP